MCIMTMTANYRRATSSFLKTTHLLLRFLYFLRVKCHGVYVLVYSLDDCITVRLKIYEFGTRTKKKKKKKIKKYITTR
jgi:hypothetical protein